MTSATSAKTETTAHRKVSIMTFNVQEFETSGGEAPIQNFLLKTYKDIVLLQENYVSSNKPRFEDFSHKNLGYKHIITCQAESWLGNSIYASLAYLERLKKDGLSAVALRTKTFDIRVGCTVPRCAAYALFGDGISVVSLHMCGGRYDDREIFHFKEGSATPQQKRGMKALVTTKDHALEVIFKKKPIVIGGDFNGQRDPAATEASLKKYLGSCAPANKARFIQFYNGGFEQLKQNGYVATYDERIGFSSVFDAMVDWIFVRDGFVEMHQIKPHRFNVKKKLSDHDAISVELLFKTKALSKETGISFESALAAKSKKGTGGVDSGSKAMVGEKGDYYNFNNMYDMYDVDGGYGGYGNAMSAMPTMPTMPVFVVLLCLDIILCILLALVCIAVCGVMGYFVLKNNKKNENENENVNVNV